MKAHHTTIESLEPRIVPSNIIAVAVGHTLKITGTTGVDNIQIASVSGQPEQFTVTGENGDTINGAASFQSPASITNIIVNLKDGADELSFLSPYAFNLAGSLSILGGADGKDISATGINVGGNLIIAMGTHPSGPDDVGLTDLVVKGSFAFASHAGDTNVTFNRDSPGISYIGGSLAFNSGPGADSLLMTDTSVHGNLTVNTGKGGGEAEFYNGQNSTIPSVIGGNLTVTNLDGNFTDGVWDHVIMGNVAFHTGSGTSNTYFDGYITDRPPVVLGSVSITGSGHGVISIGSNNEEVGAIFGKSFSVAGGMAGDTFAINKLTVGGPTHIAVAGGDNSLTIDDSTFEGSFTLLTGIGVDTVKIDTNTGTALPTTFERPVLFSLGKNALNTLTLAGGSDSGQKVIFDSTALVTGDNTVLSNPGAVVFPLGNSLKIIT